MGYTTKFEGKFELDKPLAPEHKAYLDAFGMIRHMKRDERAGAGSGDQVRHRAGLEPKPEHYVASAKDGDFGQSYDDSVIDSNCPPEGQPGLWCQWVPNKEGTAIEWDGGEKFNEYVKWIQYLIDNFLGPWGYKLNGEVIWRGEGFNDIGTLVIKDNQVKAIPGS